MSVYPGSQHGVSCQRTAFNSCVLGEISWGGGDPVGEAVKDKQDHQVTVNKMVVEAI
ncbi:MAG TPA: hypothetical protein V6D29_05135 [Leptolyngbyaceae cyanobacterium]